MAIQLHINVSVSLFSDRTWRRPPGRPRNKWLDQARNDSTRPTGDLCRRANFPLLGESVRERQLTNFATLDWPLSRRPNTPGEGATLFARGQKRCGFWLYRTTLATCYLLIHFGLQ